MHCYTHLTNHILFSSVCVVTPRYSAKRQTVVKLIISPLSLSLSLSFSSSSFYFPFSSVSSPLSFFFLFLPKKKKAFFLSSSSLSFFFSSYYIFNIWFAVYLPYNKIWPTWLSTQFIILKQKMKTKSIFLLENLLLY